MKPITVTLFNVHGLNSHIELECEYANRYYIINRWEDPAFYFGIEPNPIRQIPSMLYSSFSFEIEAEPNDIVRAWKKWYKENESKASILKNNCADAVLWFLMEFANLPEDAYVSAPTTYNHLAFGILYPSFFKRMVTLPGRVMDIAKAHFSIVMEDNTVMDKSTQVEPEQWGCFVGVTTFFQSMLEDDCQEESTAPTL